MSATKFTYQADTLSIHITRVFAVAPERLWQAMTDPQQIPQWWGPAKYKTVVEVHDLRVGGDWRYTQTDTEGHEFAFHGEFLEVDPPHRCVQTFTFEGLPDPDSHATTDTLTLTKVEGGTRMDVVSKFQTREDYEGMIASGMESGASEGYDRLATLVEA